MKKEVEKKGEELYGWKPKEIPVEELYYEFKKDEIMDDKLDKKEFKEEDAEE